MITLAEIGGPRSKVKVCDGRLKSGKELWPRIRKNCEGHTFVVARIQSARGFSSVAISDLHVGQII